MTGPAISTAQSRAFELLSRTPWAILPDMLRTLAAVAAREGESVEAVEARLGRPLQNTRTVSVQDGVAVVPVVGPIFRYANLFTQVSGATSLDVLATDFTSAVDDPQVGAIVLSIDSPGGQAAGIAEFAQMVREAPKPVVAYVDGQAASAAYWIAAAADRIAINKSAEVGSIGAVLAIDTTAGKQGVVEIVSSQSPNKRPDVTTDAGRTQLQQRIDAIAQVFIDDVAAYRGVSVDTVLSDFGRGGMLIGSAAVSAGMADSLSTLDGVLAELRQRPPKRAARAAHITGGKTMTITREQLATEAPDLVEALLAEGRAQAQAAQADALAQAREAGAAAERARIRDVQAQSLPGHEQLIESLLWDGKTTGPEAAVAVLRAEREAAAARTSRLLQDTPDPVPFGSVDVLSEAGPTRSAHEMALEIRRRTAAAAAAGKPITIAQAARQIQQEAQHG